MTKIAINRLTIKSQVADVISEKILTGEYPGGYAIRQETIASDLGVSRVPVREALLQLEKEGLVTNVPHKGAVVASLSIDDAIDIFETRRIIELHLLEKAISSATEDDYLVINNLLEEYEASVRNGAGASVLSKLNWDIHLSFLKPANRPRSLELLKSFYCLLDRYLRLQIEPESARIVAVKDHRDLYESYINKDVKLAVKLMRRHLDSAYKSIIYALNSNPHF